MWPVSFALLKTEKCESTFLSIFPDIRKSLALLEGSRAWPACLLITAVLG